MPTRFPIRFPGVKQALIVAAMSMSLATAQAATTIQVFKSATCGCCGKWVEHMRAAGFQVSTRDVADVGAERKRLGMPDRLGSCHTATVSGYTLEGHVPAADVQHLLKQKPKALGLAVPGMPPGSPGMEGAHAGPYDTLLVSADGNTRVFAAH
jgi:hypothetical protein